MHAAPPPRPGDLVRIIAPAGPFDRTLFWRGVGFLAQTFRVQLGRHLFCRHGFRAGAKAERAEDLRDALACPKARLVVCARGGVGSADLLDAGLGQEWVSTVSPYKWLVGFSDITVLHAQWQAWGLPSIHASNVTSLGVGCAPLRERWLSHVLNPWQTRHWTLEPLFAGEAEGPVIGGNLAVLHDLCASRAWRPPPGSILFIEEVAEPPYRIYRMLTALRRAGVLDHLHGLVVGQVTSSHPGIHGQSARQVFTELCSEWRLPSAWGLPSGHEPANNHPLTLGAPARLVADEQTARFSVGVA